MYKDLFLLSLEMQTHWQNGKFMNLNLTPQQNCAKKWRHQNMEHIACIQTQAILKNLHFQQILPHSLKTRSVSNCIEAIKILCVQLGGKAPTSFWEGWCNWDKNPLIKLCVGDGKRKGVESRWDKRKRLGIGGQDVVSLYVLLPSFSSFSQHSSQSHTLSPSHLFIYLLSQSYFPFLLALCVYSSFPTWDALRCLDFRQTNRPRDPFKDVYTCIYLMGKSV